MPDDPDPLAMQAETQATPGFKAHQDMEAIHRSLDVFAGNAVELIAHLKSFEDDPSVSLSVFAEGDDHAFGTQYQTELARWLHNFVSSVKSLIEHSRHIIARMYEPTHALRVEYQTRAAAFADEPRSKLVQQLREYVLHYELAPTVGTLEFGRSDDTMSSPLLLSRATWKLAPDVLLRWNGWKPAVRAYLQNASDINLLQLVEGYVREVFALYTWLYEAQVIEHQDDLDATNARIEELHRAFPFPSSTG